MSDFNFIPQSGDRILESFLVQSGWCLCVLREEGIAGDGREETVVAYWQLYLCMSKWVIKALLLDACWTQWLDGKWYTHLAKSIPICINRPSLSHTNRHTQNYSVMVMWSQTPVVIPFHIYLPQMWYFLALYPIVWPLKVTDIKTYRG